MNLSHYQDEARHSIQAPPAKPGSLDAFLQSNNITGVCGVVDDRNAGVPLVLIDGSAVLQDLRPIKLAGLDPCLRHFLDRRFVVRSLR
jgi:hypothetical protein